MTNAVFQLSATGATTWLARLRAERCWRVLLGACLLALLVGCGTTSNRSNSGYYRVAPGDTLTQIARKHGQSVDNLVRWNKLPNGNRLDVGQLLRVKAPGGNGAVAASPPAARSGGAARAPAPAPAVSRAPARSIKLIWPANGKVTRGTGTASNGLNIANAAGTPVVAAAAGTVAYADNGLRGYGNLVLVQHADNFITVYAHNRALRVKEGQRVKQGQTIAEMGNTDSAQVVLYFELRYDGKPTDPNRFLPAR